MKCCKCNENRESIHYRAKDRGVCVFCANTLSADQLIEKITTESALVKPIVRKPEKVKIVYRDNNPKVIIKKEVIYVRTKKGSTRIVDLEKRNLPIYVVDREREYEVYKRNVAHKRGYSFSIDIDTFFELKAANCFYCGGKGGGIDRVFNERGYEPDNCVPCCTRCNKMKLDTGVFSFIDHCRRIINNVDRE